MLWYELQRISKKKHWSYLFNVTQSSWRFRPFAIRAGHNRKDAFNYNTNFLGEYLKQNLPSLVLIEFSWKSVVFPKSNLTRHHIPLAADDFLPFVWTTKSLLWCPFRCVEWWSHISHCDRVLRLCNLEKSSCSGELGCRSFVKTRFEQFVFYLSSEKTCAFLYATIRPDFTEHFTCTFFIKKRQAKVLDSTCQTIQVWKQLQNVNFDGFWTFMVWHFWQL